MNIIEIQYSYAKKHYDNDILDREFELYILTS